MRRFVFVIFTMACLRLALFRTEPTGTVSAEYTDHIAHIGEARALVRMGLNLWRIPSASVFAQLSPEERSALPPDLRAYAEREPKDVRRVPGFLSNAPLVLNYTHLPRCYPPGAALVAAPSAFLYHMGAVSFSSANRIFLGVLAALWLIAMLVVIAPWEGEKPSWPRMALTSIVALYMLYWSQEGFYDFAAVAAGIVGVALQRNRQFGYAALGWGLAVLIHSRLLGLLPLASLSMLEAVRAWPQEKVKQRAAFALGLTCFVGALAFAALIQPVVQLHSANAAGLRNILRPESGNIVIPILYAGLVLGLGSALVRAKSYVDAVVVVGVGAAFVLQRYVCPWYWLLIVPWSISAQRDGLAMLKVEAYARTAMTTVFIAACLACHR